MKYTPACSAIVTLAMLVCNAHALDLPPEPDAPAYVPGQVIVKLKRCEEVPPDSARAAMVAKRHGEAQVTPLLKGKPRLAAERRGLGTIYLFDFGEKAPTRQLVQALAGDPDVVYAEPNAVCRIATVPDDPYYESSGSWGQAYRDMWGLHRVGLGPLGSGSGWDIETGSSHPVTVAVIDTGLDHAHPDIAGQIWCNPNEIPDDGIDNDDNGYIDDVLGWNFVDDTPLPADGHGHGTHCAGTIAAASNNGIGVAGISWGAKIMPLKGLSDGGGGGSAGLAAAIIYAADNGARILSSSWGGTTAEPIQVLVDACDYAAELGCLIVAAAGNNHNDLYPPHPAGYASVMAVAAAKPHDLMATFTNYGPFVEITAPGVDVLSLRAEGTDMYRDGTHIVGDAYYRASGTSMACPHVAGAAALLWSAHPDWSAQQVREHLRRTADDLERKNPDYIGGIGGGMLNIQTALTWSAMPLVRLRDIRIDDTGAEHVNQAADPGETFTLIASLHNNYLAAAEVIARLTSTSPCATIEKDTATYGAIGADENHDGAGDGFVVTVSPACLPGDELTFDLEITADGSLRHEEMSIVIAQPEPELRGIVIYDPDGDNDREVDGGEEVQLIVRLGNGRHAGPAREITAILVSTDPHLAILQNTSKFPDLAAGVVVTNRLAPFRLHVSSDFPPGHVAQAELHLTGAGFSKMLDIELSLTRAEREFADYVPIDDGFGPIDPFGLTVVIDDQDRLHVTWAHPDLDYLDYMATYRCYEQGHWGPRRYMGVGGPICPALDPQGRVHLTWNQYVLVDDFFSLLVASGIYYRDLGDGWGPRVNITNTPWALQNMATHATAADSHGRVHVVWLYNNYRLPQEQRLNHSVGIQGQWQSLPPIVASPTFSVYDSLRLLAGRDGRLWLFYKWSASNPVLMFRTWNGSSWSSQQQVPTGGLGVLAYDVRLDSAERPHVAYWASRDDLPMFYVNQAGGWSTPRQFPSVPGAIHMDTPRLHIDRNDTVHLQWKVRTRPANQSLDQIYSQRRASGVWSDPEQLTSFGSDAPRYVFEHALVTDRLDRRHLFYIASYKGVFHLMIDSGHAVVRGDFDGDGDVDQSDYGAFQACYSGPGIAQPAEGCAAARLDHDEDVDLDDFAILQACISGAGVLASPGCSN